MNDLLDMRGSSSAGSSAIRRWLARFRQAERGVVALALIAMVGCVLWGVATRYGSHQPAPWTGEVAAVAFCWCSLVAAGSFYAQHLHPRIFSPARFLLKPLRGFVQRWSQAVEIIVLSMVGYYGLQEALGNLDNPTSILRMPVSIFYFPLLWFSLSSLTGILARA